MGEIVPFNELSALGERLRASGKTIVFTNGHFDLLHVGHLRYLSAASDLGDVLVVGVNDDEITRQRKGPGRPILPEEERAEMLAGLATVDYVAIFHELTATACIERLMPDIYVKGGDYAPGGADLPEAAAVEFYGARVVILPLIDGRSTSSIVQAIREERSVR